MNHGIARAAVVALAVGGVGGAAASGALIDDFSDTSLGEYAFTKVLDQGTVTNTAFSSPSGVLQSTSSGADGAEQVLLFRNDGISLAAGEELQVDAAITAASGNDLGIAVGATPTAGVRSNFLFVSFRAATQLNARGFIGTTEVQQFQAFGVSPEQLFIARTDVDTFEVGYYDNNARTVLATREVGANTTIGDNVGFYSDLRTNGAGYNGLDNLRITAIPEPGGLALLGLGGTIAVRCRRRRRSCECA